MAEASEKTDRKSNSGRTKSEDNTGIGIIDIFRIIAGLLLLNCIASYFVTGDSVTWNYRPWWIRPNILAARLRGPVILTDNELLQYDGSNESLPIYLALNGTIFDVTAGQRIYAPGGPYNVFAGRDATRAYITGCFKEDSIADYRGVEWTFVPTDVPHFVDKSDEDLSEAERGYRYEMVGLALEEVDKTIAHWQKVFRGETGKDYFEVGYVQRDPKLIDMQPIRPLCTAAEKKRPKSKFDKTKKYLRSERTKRAKKAQLEYTRLTNPALKEEAEKAAAGAGVKGHDEI
ncbi:hypothetical protein PRZ48_003763 [Zasmidium cellare]|uniref:Cytochrome b5 heme-binding domain-containing protein n=1 Tax=Zasmidium cellare TaxID=395010 RepID=A0ABR0EXK2_ZASCE|nr:hypothetical protein PRZ48_003763 [Zasmidium cellare]